MANYRGGLAPPLDRRLNSAKLSSVMTLNSFNSTIQTPRFNVGNRVTLANNYASAPFISKWPVKGGEVYTVRAGWKFGLPYGSIERYTLRDSNGVEFTWLNAQGLVRAR